MRIERMLLMKKDWTETSSPSRKYRIAFIIDGLSMGGAERLMVPILKHLSRTDFDAYVCVLQSKDGNPIADEIRTLDIPVECLHVKHLRDVTALPRLMKYLTGIQADLVHTQLEFSNILGNISATLLGLPSVCTIHVMPSLDVSHKARLHQRVEGLALRYFCDHVISVCEEARQHHLAMSGASSEQISTIYNGVDLSTFVKIDRAHARVAVRHEFGIPSYAHLFTTLAVLRPQKGIQYMIQALPSILSSNPDTYYLVVGGGSYRDTLMKEANQLNAKDRVIFAGMRNDVARLLAASDVFILPSLTEALPTVLAEAMASRLPIVASRVGGIPEMVSDGQSGYLVGPGDPDGLANACIDLMADPAKRAAMGSAGWQIVDQKFNIQHQVAKLRELYLSHIKAHEK